MPKGTGRSKAVGWRKTSPTNTEDGGTGELCDLRPGVSEQEESSGTTGALFTDKRLDSPQIRSKSRRVGA